MTSSAFRVGAFALLSIISSTTRVRAQSEGTSTDDLRSDEALVRARAEEVFETPGSVHVVDEDELQRLDYNDPLQVLARVPGVYIRQEEGYGLRPNIGLRGANAERSRKITLMEDGVLMGPAPYSAPAAYYFPLMARMTSVEVTMGPAAILYGPTTVGGAIDFVGRAIPNRSSGRADLSLGSTWFGRGHLHYGDSNEWGGFLVEALHLRTDGFQRLDTAVRDQNTGFERTDLLLRGDLHGMATADLFHKLEATFGFGREGSNATYLGLDVDDFRADPYRRYAASQLDRMEWWRSRAQLRYLLTAGESFDLDVVGYFHHLDRNWHRVDRVCQAELQCLSIGPLVEDPNGTTAVGPISIPHAPLFAALRGGNHDGPFILAGNHRVFNSTGVEAKSNSRFRTGDFAHHVQAGMRLHYDEITRDHRPDSWREVNSQLVRIGEVRGEQNFASTWALALYANWAVSFAGFTLTPGVRGELMWMDFQDRLSGNRVQTQQYAALPGVGLEYALLTDLALFGGAHLGFAPVAPGQAADVLPETAWNYELGARYGRLGDRTQAALAYFVSDYSNLSTTCGGSLACGGESGDVQFNGGKVTILGIEARASHSIAAGESEIPLGLTYTWTWSRFGTSFESENVQFAAVKEGSQLPYVPEHQFAFQAGWRFRMVDINASGSFVSEMRDSAGIGASSAMTDAYFVLDATAGAYVMPNFRVYVRGENLTDARPISSYRPYGARGIKPVLVLAGFSLDFE